MISIDITEKQAEELQNAVDEHMNLCYEYLDYEGQEVPEQYDLVSSYCGCGVCETREHLMATFNYLRDAGIVDIAVE